MVHTPNVCWAQREDSVWVTIELEHPENLSVNLEAKKLSIKADQNGEAFSLELPLFSEIDPNLSRFSQHRFLDFCLHKVEPSSWPRLTEQPLKRPWLKVDWSRWQDSDDEAENNPFDISGMRDFNELGKFQGQVPDSDDEDEEEQEDLPDLKDTVDASL